MILVANSRNAHAIPIIRRVFYWKFEQVDFRHEHFISGARSQPHQHLLKHFWLYECNKCLHDGWKQNILCERRIELNLIMNFENLFKARWIWLSFHTHTHTRAYVRTSDQMHGSRSALICFNYIDFFFTNQLKLWLILFCCCIFRLKFLIHRWYILCFSIDRLH